MTLQVAKPKSRKIADKNHNRYALNGLDEHKATQLSPSSLLKPFSTELKRDIEAKQKEIERKLIKVIGAPLFSDFGFILYKGDCCELLSKLEDINLNIDLTLTSPPYNIGKEYETNLTVEDYVDWCSKWMAQIYNATKSDGTFWLNVGYLEVKGKGLCVPIAYLLWDKSAFYLLQEIVWKYGAGVMTKNRLCPRNEKWLFYIKDRLNYTFNLDDIRDPNVKYPNQKKNGKFRCNPLGKNPSDVWKFPKITTGEKRSSKERTGHPAQFPLKVVERIIKATSNPTDLVFDPFAGSCSAGIASIGLGRIFIGIETRSDYCDISIKRYKDFKLERESAQKQLQLI